MDSRVKDYVGQINTLYNELCSYCPNYKEHWMNKQKMFINEHENQIHTLDWYDTKYNTLNSLTNHYFELKNK